MTARRKTQHPLWSTWHNAKHVCNNPNNRQWSCYGGRGITVCAEWENDFWAFADWMDNNLGPRPGCSSIWVLDRINNNKGYKPGNLRWATRQEDSNNRRTNHYISYKGTKKTFAEWSREVNVPLTTIWSRIIDKGWSISEALGFKQRKNRQLV
jgi:hypothetical protein